MVGISTIVERTRKTSNFPIEAKFVNILKSPIRGICQTRLSRITAVNAKIEKLFNEYVKRKSF